LAPTAVGLATGTFDAELWTLSVTDASTDDGPDADALNDAAPSLKVVMDWGDGTTKTVGLRGATFTHQYKKAGTFTVTQRVIDSPKLQTNVLTRTVTTAYFTISGTVHKSALAGGGLLSGASVQVKLGALVKQYTTGVGGTFTTGATLKPGAYTVTVKKTGYTFPSPTSAPVGPSNTSINVVALTP
jgi:hypothetical protein